MIRPASQRPYTKPALSPDDLLKHLVSRGLQVEDGIFALATLERVDYYRLLGYLRSFQHRGEDGIRRFRPGTALEDVVALYEFDRKLRLLSMDAAERIEVFLRASIVSEVAVPLGPHFYLDSRHFQGYDRWSDFHQAVYDERERSPVLRHYFRTYTDPPMPPIWSAMEAVSFGTLSHLYSNLAEPIQRSIARRFDFPVEVLVSWFRSTTMLRNLSAHHARLWNTRIGADKPMKAKKIRSEFAEGTNTFFARAVAVVALLEQTRRDLSWKPRLRSLMDEHPFVDETLMGFPPGWRQRGFWQRLSE